MKRLSFAVSAMLTLVMALTGQVFAQQKPARDQLARLTARTEARARLARSNFERLRSQHPEFLPELQRIAARLGTRYEWLLNLIASESSFIPSARNPLPGQTASGLLQIIEATAAGMGTTTAAIRRLNPVEQLRLLERFYSPFRGLLNSQGDVYLAAFRGFSLAGGPETVVAPLNYSAKERRAYLLNRGLDFDGDGRITKGELAVTAYGVGRFGEAQFVALAQPKTFIAQQKVTPNKVAADDLSPRVTSMYVAAPGREAESSMSGPLQLPVARARTRSIYTQ